jgi:hypothetical protein
MAMTDTISPAQVSFITSLLRDRLSTLGFPTVEAAEAALNLTSQTKGTATVLIDRLKGMPKDPDTAMPDVVARSTRNGKGNRPGTCTACGHLVPQDAGYYYLTNSGTWAVHHKVGECSSAPVPAPVQVTEGLYKAADGTIVLVYMTRNARLAGKVHTGRSFRYQQGAAALAATGHRLTAEEASAFGKLHGNCVACAKDLTDDRSIAVGYGPVCAKRHGWPWGV